MHKKHIISIIGCGWLGFPLAESLIVRGYHVKGSTTTEGKLEKLKTAGIDPYLVHFGYNTPTNQDVLNCDTLIITVPPGSRSVNGPRNYRLMADYIFKNAGISPAQKIILVSSTSVYGDTNQEITEKDPPLPDSDAGRLLLEVENQILAIETAKICVIRPSGLVGPGRHPGRFFKNKTRIPDGLSPINLIHRDDVIGIIMKMIRQENAEGIYNACSPEHPARHEFYALAAKMAHYPPPDFIAEKTVWKVINSLRVSEELKYQFKFPRLMDWLAESPAEPL